MGAIRSASVAFDAVVRNPILFAVAVLIAFLSAVVATGYQVPTFGFVLGLGLSILVFFVEPFLSGGLLGMGHEALDGPTDLETFVAEGKENYVTLLLARLLVTVATIAYYFVATIVFFAVTFAIGMGAMEGMEPGQGPSQALGIGSIVLVAGLFLLAMALYYLVGLFVQFHPAAIVVGDADLIESFKESVGLVRANLVSALGYSVIVGAVGLVIGAVPLAFAFFTQDFSAAMTEDPAMMEETMMSTTDLAAFFGLSLLLQAIVLPFLRTFHVSFYENVRTDG